MDTTLPSPNRASVILSAVLAVGFAGALAAPASAETSRPAAQPAAQSVSYAGLDLASPGDARLILRRIKVAAASVCGPEPAVSSLHPRAQHDWRACTTGAVDRAVADLGAPLVIAMHNGQLPVGPALASR